MILSRDLTQKNLEQVEGQFIFLNRKAQEINSP